MSRELTREEGIKLAKHIVETWETIPNRANKLAQRLHAVGELIDLQRVIEVSMRSMVGGEEVYEAAKKVVLELSET